MIPSGNDCESDSHSELENGHRNNGFSIRNGDFNHRYVTNYQVVLASLMKLTSKKQVSLGDVIDKLWFIDSQMRTMVLAYLHTTLGHVWD